MKIPSEQEYARMLGRLQGAMVFACQALIEIADGAERDRDLRKLAKMLERIGNDENDPVPTNVPNASMNLSDLPG